MECLDEEIGSQVGRRECNRGDATRRSQPSRRRPLTKTSIIGRAHPRIQVNRPAHKSSPRPKNAVPETIVICHVVGNHASFERRHTVSITWICERKSCTKALEKALVFPSKGFWERLNRAANREANRPSRTVVSVPPVSKNPSDGV